MKVLAGRRFRLKLYDILTVMIFQARLREMVTYEDLEEETTTESAVLKIKDKNQFCRGIAVETTQVSPEKKLCRVLVVMGLVMTVV